MNSTNEKRGSASEFNELLACNCGKKPTLMRAPFTGMFYECCGVMSSFPGVGSEEQARRDWNERFAR